MNIRKVEKNLDPELLTDNLGWFTRGHHKSVEFVDDINERLKPEPLLPIEVASIVRKEYWKYVRHGKESGYEICDKNTHKGKGVIPVTVLYREDFESGDD